MKYYIELDVRAIGVQLLRLTTEEKNQLLSINNLDNIYYDWVTEKCYEFEVEREYLTPNIDRFSLTISDENDNIVYESEDVNDLVDQTYDDEGEERVKGWKFKGVEDGCYLTRIQTIKGSYYTGEFELNEPFDEEKLYIIRDQIINDDLLGDYVYPIDTLYYQQGDGYDAERDKICLDFESDCGEQYYSTHIFQVTEKDYWKNLQK